MSHSDRIPVVTLSAALLALLVADATPGASAPPPPPAPRGYFVDSTQAFTPRPVRWEAKDGEFTVSIRREAPDSAAARLLGIAEATYPPRDLLVRIAEGQGYEMGSDSARVPLWWCRGVGVSRIPYAVTAGALAHYGKLTEHLREREFREAGTPPLFRSELTYRATIARQETFALNDTIYADGYMADLSLSWSYDDGTFAPFTRAHRIVLLSSAGAVLAVRGDGEAEERVDISTHRGVGRQERILR
jgi:hypothetical protein